MDAPYRAPSTRAAGALRCLYCGAAHSPSDTVCAACKSDIGLVCCNGCGRWIAAAEAVCACGTGRPPAAPHDAVACPRCHGVLKDLSLGAPGVVVHECERCRGTFLDVHDWNELADRAAAGEKLPVGQFVPLPPGAELPRQVMLAEVPCPDCSAPMDRVTFAVRSRTVVDVCKLHGIWLDAGELVAILAFMKFREEHGGDMPLSEVELEENAAYLRQTQLAELTNRAIRDAAEHLEQRVEEDRRNAQGMYFPWQDVVAALRFRR